MNTTDSRSQQKFPLGRIVATPAALDTLAKFGQSAHGFLMRHATGDWGVVCKEDSAANDEAIALGERLLSAYILGDGTTKVWVITEADRSSTCVLMPDDY